MKVPRFVYNTVEEGLLHESGQVCDCCCSLPIADVHLLKFCTIDMHTLQSTHEKTEYS